MWKEIAETAPKAFEKWYKEEGFDLGELSKEELLEKLIKSEVSLYDRRELYDFFDGNHIYLTVSPQYEYNLDTDQDGEVPHFIPEKWAGDIHNESNFLDGVHNLSSRYFVEQALFKKAFVILEERL